MAKMCKKNFLYFSHDHEKKVCFFGSNSGTRPLGNRQVLWKKRQNAHFLKLGEVKKSYDFNMSNF